jgi:phosphatidylglycerol:prolipoprotein diacylglycerol transferase
MQSSFIVDANKQGYFTLFYAAAFLVTFIILVLEGRKRNLPQLPWLITITTGTIFFVLGCRIVTLTPNDWMAITNNQPLGHDTGMVMLGGLLLSVPAIFLVKRFVNLNYHVLDAYTFVLPVGMFLQRIGCFLNGCCYGTITTSGWGVRYGPHSSAFHDQVTSGVIPYTSSISLSIHPVQLYESVACLLFAILLSKVRRKLKSDGSLLFLSGLTYYLTRFATEFFRSEKAYAVKISTWLHLNSIQWFMLFMILISCMILFIKEKNKRQCVIQPEANPFSVRYIVYFLTISTLFFFVSKWLSPMEILVVYLAIFSTGSYLVVELFKSLTLPSFRIASLCMVFVSLILMSQTYPEQATSDSTKISYNTISVGGLFGKQDLSIITKDCDGNKVGETAYKHRYHLAALGISRTIQTGKAKSFTFGLNAYTGIHDEYVTGEIESDRPELRSYGFNPFAQLDLPYFAVGVGAHLGDMSFIYTEPMITSVKRYSFYPQAYMRFGDLRRFFGEISLARQFPSSFPGSVFSTNIGFSLLKGSANKGVFRIGTSSATGLFLSPTIPMGKHFVIEPYVGFMGSIFMKAAGYGTNAGTIGSLGLSYKFDKKQRR